MRNARKRVNGLSSVDLISDMSALLDLAGVDHVDQQALDDMLHAGYAPQALIDFASHMSRRTGSRIVFAELVSEFTAGERAA